MSERAKCPKCGAVQNPKEGDLSLTCGSILSEVDNDGLEYQSPKCRIAELESKLADAAEALRAARGWVAKAISNSGFECKQRNGMLSQIEAALARIDEK